MTGIRQMNVRGDKRVATRRAAVAGPGSGNAWLRNRCASGALDFEAIEVNRNRPDIILVDRQQAHSPGGAEESGFAVAAEHDLLRNLDEAAGIDLVIRDDPPARRIADEPQIQCIHAGKTAGTGERSGGIDAVNDLAVDRLLVDELDPLPA